MRAGEMFRETLTLGILKNQIGIRRIVNTRRLWLSCQRGSRPTFL